MNKILIIIGREFSTRVRKKTFLLLTICVPVLMVLLYAFLMWMLLKDDTESRNIAVVNESAIEAPLEDINNTKFEYVDKQLSEANASDFLKENNYYAVMWIPQNVMDSADIPIYSFSQITMDLKGQISSSLRHRIEEIKKDSVLAEVNVPDLDKKLAATKTPVSVRTLVVSETGESKESSSELASIIGFAAGMVIYFFIFMYSSMVMRGVIEEKTNRIIEVLVSSVKPFQFLLGKIIGIASVGLVQFLIWVILGSIAVLAVQSVIMPNIDLEALRSTTNLASMAQTGDMSVEQLKMVQSVANTINPTAVFSFLGAFIFYFIGGYLLYASLFAAIGAAVDNETDSQQFMTPLSIILVVALYIGIAAMKNPETPLVVWSSMIPFTSPIVMLVRLPFGVPAWQIVTSMAALVGAFIFFTWISGKIYRIGILMYGKKVTWKELYKWLKY